MIECTLGIDMGTSGVKAALLELDTLKLITLATQSYDNPPLQSPDMLWQATAQTVRSATAGIDPSAIRGISLSGQMHGTVMYDDRDEIIGPVINWQDKRGDIPIPRYGGRTTVELMMERLACPEFDDLGVDVLPSGYLGVTLFYLKENEPALFERIHHVVLPGDFIRAMLLGACDRATDPTNACGTGLFNTRLSRWHEGIIARLGLPREILPAVHDSAEVAGPLAPEAADMLNLMPGTPVVYGGGDNQMSLLGNGLISDDSPALINIGTGAQVSRVTSQYARRQGVDTRSYFNGLYALVGASTGGGRSYAQLHDELQRREGRNISYKEMDELAAQAPIGAEGLALQIPARGESGHPEGFLGRTGSHGVGHEARAVMEGVTLDLYRLRPPASTDGPTFMVGAGKGLQYSRVWAQMAADIFGCPIKITDFENAVWGAALVAAVGIGAVSDVRDALATIDYIREFTPDPASTTEYRRLIASRSDR